MGKKRQKVRWTAVGETFYASGDESCDPQNGTDSEQPMAQSGENQRSHPHNHRETNGHHVGGHGHHKGSGHHRHYSGGPPPSGRRYGSNWNPAPLAPRFERKAAAAQAASEYTNGIDHQIEGCEFEQLPDGFTKIRSKNLDVLFKRDYYAHKIEISQSNGSSIKEDGSDLDEGDDSDTQGNGSAQEGSIHGEGQGDSKDGPKEKSTEENTSQVVSLPYSPNAPPFIPQSQASRPNLFLYSPSSNTMIPCEEIIIPNPVMGPEGPMYQGPSNIYLAFPMENGGSPGVANGYSTMGPHQQYMPHPLHHQTSIAYDQYGVPYQASYQLTTTHEQGSGIQSHDNSLYQSSSDNGAESNSNDSTCPHSPPDLSMYSPITWADGNAMNYMQGSQATQPQPSQQIWYQNSECSVPYPNKGSHNVTTHSASALSKEKLPSGGVSVESPTETGTVEDEELKSHIPGLHPDHLNSKKRVQKKKRRKKSLAAVPVQEEHRGSSSSEDFTHAQRLQLGQPCIQNGKGSLLSSAQLSEEEESGMEETAESLLNGGSDGPPTPAITVSPPPSGIASEAHRSDSTATVPEDQVLDQAAQELERVKAESQLAPETSPEKDEDSGVGDTGDCGDDKPEDTNITPSVCAQGSTFEPTKAHSPCAVIPDEAKLSTPAEESGPGASDPDKLGQSAATTTTTSELADHAAGIIVAQSSVATVQCNNTTNTQNASEERVPVVEIVGKSSGDKLSSPSSCPVLSHKEKVPEQAPQNKSAPNSDKPNSKHGHQASSSVKVGKRSPKHGAGLNHNASGKSSKPKQPQHLQQPENEQTNKTLVASASPSSNTSSAPDIANANESSNVLSSEASVMKKLYSVVCKEETKVEDGKMGGATSQVGSSSAHEKQEDGQSSPQSSPPRTPQRNSKSGRQSRRSKNNHANNHNNNNNNNNHHYQTASSSNRSLPAEKSWVASEAPLMEIAEASLDIGGEWETKKRRNRNKTSQSVSVSSRNGKTASILDQPQAEEGQESLLTVVPAEQPTRLEQSPQVDIAEHKTAIALSSPTEERSPTASGSEERAKSEDTNSTTVASSETKRTSTKRKKKQRSSGQSSGDKPSIRPILVQDGLLELRTQMAVSQAMEQARLEGSSALRMSPISSLFVSSIGHGIQHGPMDLGRIGLGKYSPPDRTEEIPLNLRQDMPEDEGGEEAQDSHHDPTTEATAIPQKSSEIDLD